MTEQAKEAAEQTEQSETYLAIRYRFGRMVDIFDVPATDHDVRVFSKYKRVRDERTAVGGVVIRVCNRAKRHLNQHEVWLIRQSTFLEHINSPATDSRICMELRTLSTRKEDGGLKLHSHSVPSVAALFNGLNNVHADGRRVFSERLWYPKTEKGDG